MRILLITPILPYPPDSGPKIKTYHVLRYLANAGHTITLASFVRQDEEFIIYSEETDWCYRIRQQGWRTYAVPGAQVIHYGGQTMNRVRRAALERLYRNKTLFFRKHHGQFSAWLFKISLMLSSIGKLLVWFVLLASPANRGRARDELSAHWQVCRCALFL